MTSEIKDGKSCSTCIHSEAARKILCSIEAGKSTFDDERLDSINCQIDKTDYEKLKALLK